MRERTFGPVVRPVARAFLHLELVHSEEVLVEEVLGGGQGGVAVGRRAGAGGVRVAVVAAECVAEPLPVLGCMRSHDRAETELSRGSIHRPKLYFRSLRFARRGRVNVDVPLQSTKRVRMIVFDGFLLKSPSRHQPSVGFRWSSCAE